MGYRFAWEQYFKEFLIYLSAIIGIAAIFAAMTFICYRASVDEWINFLVSNASWVAGVNIVVIFILFVDRVLLRYFFYKSLPEGS